MVIPHWRSAATWMEFPTANLAAVKDFLADVLARLRATPEASPDECAFPAKTPLKQCTLSRRRLVGGYLDGYCIQGFEDPGG